MKFCITNFQKIMKNECKRIQELVICFIQKYLNRMKQSCLAWESTKNSNTHL